MYKTNNGLSAAFFDLDLTITNRDSFRSFLSWLYLGLWRNWMHVPSVLLFGTLRKIKIISLQKFKEKSLVTLYGKEKDLIEKIGKIFFDEHLKKNIRKKALEKVNFHKNKGDLVFNISPFIVKYLQPIAKYLECQDYRCSELAYENNKFIGKFKGKDCLGDEKVKKVKVIKEKYGIDLSVSFAYSDHESDLPLLEIMGNPVAFTPTNKLRKLAVEKRWVVEEW